MNSVGRELVMQSEYQTLLADRDRLREALKNLLKWSMSINKEALEHLLNAELDEMERVGNEAESALAASEGGTSNG